MRGHPLLPLVAFAGLVLALACNDDQPEYAGQPCDTPADCYPEVADPSQLSGEIECLDRVEGGYCTHFCEVDEDCCAVAGECTGEHPQVCAPFENSGQKRCFLSCEADVLGEWEENDFCREFAHPEFGCRSSGGGSENRKICVP